MRSTAVSSQLLFECWIGRYPFLQPGQHLRDLDEEEVSPHAPIHNFARELRSFVLRDP
jgi:hypothetical protein